MNPTLSVRIVPASERETWASTAAGGWREFGEIADLMLDLMRVSVEREDSASFLVELDGAPIATASLAIHDRVALFAGASTVPEWRRRGAQRLLFESRRQFARNAGCELAMVSVEPGSSSQRNAERHGFRVAYTRTKWELSTSAQGARYSFPTSRSDAFLGYTLAPRLVPSKFFVSRPWSVYYLFIASNR